MDAREIHAVTPSKVTDRRYRIGGAHIAAEPVKRQPVLGYSAATKAVQDKRNVPLICPPPRAFKVSDIHTSTTVHHHNCRPWP